MPVRTYTNEQLHHLRRSPLVKKPEHLPPIEQWIEYVYADGDSREKLRIPHSESQQQLPQQRESSSKTGTRGSRPAAGDASPMGNFSTGQRPSLLPTRTTGSRTGSDIVLGPPKTAFASSRNISRLSGTADGATSNDTLTGDDLELGRLRSFGDRQQSRKSMNGVDKDERADRDSWTSLRDRRAAGEHDDSRAEGNERYAKFSRRDRELNDDRRNGDRQDNRWSHKDDKKSNGDRAGGWRERESNRREKTWDRGESAEKDPEWFGEPVTAKRHDDDNDDDDVGMGMARTQEEFQKWKDMMNARTKGPTNDQPQSTPTPEVPQMQEKTTMKPAMTLKLEGVSDKPFGTFGMKSPDGSVESGQLTAKIPSGKGKSSRFASMFKKEDTLSPPLPEDLPRSTSLEEPTDGSSKDKEGFQRILQMLGGTSLGQPMTSQQGEPASPPPKIPVNGTRQRSRFFDAPPKSPEAIQTPPALPMFPPSLQPQIGGEFPQMRGPQQPGPRQTFGFGTPSDNPHNAMPHESMAQHGTRERMPSSNRPGEQHESLPPREVSTPDVNIQNLLAAQRSQRQQVSNKDSEFLLGLLQGQTARPPSQQTLPGKDFSLWLDQAPEPHAPKPRAPPPPGLIDDQLLRNTPRQDQQQSNPAPHGDVTSRHPSQRAPPGFDEQTMFFQQQQQQQQRRIFHEQQQQHPSSQQYGPTPNRRANPLPPGAPNVAGPNLQQPLSPSGGPPGSHEFPFMQAGPPPGFPPNMRHPQGFANIPNIFQAPQAQGQQGPRDLQPGYGAGVMPGQQLGGGPPPPGFGMGIPPAPGQMPSNLMSMRSGATEMAGANLGPGYGRGRFEGGFEQRR